MMDHTTKPAGRLLQVQGLAADEVAYNPAVIIQQNQKIIAARVESANSYWLNPHTYNSRIQFFSVSNQGLVPLPDVPVFQQYEDPFASWLSDQNGQPQLLFGGVRLDFSGQQPVIATRLHLAASVQQLDPGKVFAEIRGMKDIRFCQLPSRKLAVFTRPTTGPAAPGRIGFTILDSVDQLKNPDFAEGAELLPLAIDAAVKIGANEVFFHPLTEHLHVFCHLATVEGSDFEETASLLHYAGYQFELDPAAPFAQPIQPQLVVSRADFAQNTGLSKGPRFADVVFPGGTGGFDQKELFVGVEDARIGVIAI